MKGEKCGCKRREDFGRGEKLLAEMIAEKSGDCSRKGKNENRINAQRTDRIKRSALKKCGAVDKEEQLAVIRYI